jgi:TPR repeat protein
MEAVGLAHYLGRGTAEDPAQAAQWFRRAGNAGEVASQFILATLYEKGEGVERDERLALAWYERAAAQGDVAAKAKLNAARSTPKAPP